MKPTPRSSTGEGDIRLMMIILVCESRTPPRCGRLAPRLVDGNCWGLGSGESGGCLCAHLPQLAWGQAGLRGIERLARPVLALLSL